MKCVDLRRRLAINGYPSICTYVHSAMSSKEIKKSQLQLKALLAMPFRFPARKIGALLECSWLPEPLLPIRRSHQALSHLLPFIFFQFGYAYMLNMPCVLILHQGP